MPELLIEFLAVTGVIVLSLTWYFIAWPEIMRHIKPYIIPPLTIGMGM